MANMGYCRFENTFNDLEDCFEHVNDKDLSDMEKSFRDKLIDMCVDISDEFSDDD